MKASSRVQEAWQPGSHLSLLLQNISRRKEPVPLPRGGILFNQGDPADSIFFIQSGSVRLSSLSADGKQGILATAVAPDFLGEAVLVGNHLRFTAATVRETSTVFQIDREAMLRALRAEPALAAAFVAALLARGAELQQNLCDQMFYDAKERLARVLINLSRFDPGSAPSGVRVTHQTLGEMIGATRSHVSRFMKEFENIGVIEYKDDLIVKADLLTDFIQSRDAGERKA